MHVVQTAGVPPNQGNTHLLMIGWTWNTRNAPSNVVAANQMIEVWELDDDDCGDLAAMKSPERRKESVG
jgi:hypothetical protein